MPGSEKRTQNAAACGVARARANACVYNRASSGEVSDPGKCGSACLSLRVQRMRARGLATRPQEGHEAQHQALEGGRTLRRMGRWCSQLCRSNSPHGADTPIRHSCTTRHISERLTAETQSLVQQTATANHFRLMSSWVLLPFRCHFGGALTDRYAADWCLETLCFSALL